MEQADQSIRRAIRVEQIRDGASISEQTDLMGMIRLEQSKVEASRVKHGRLERSENITKRDKIRAKREKIRVVRRSERISRKIAV